MDIALHLNVRVLDNQVKFNSLVFIVQRNTSRQFNKIIWIFFIFEQLNVCIQLVGFLVFAVMWNNTSENYHESVASCDWANFRYRFRFTHVV